MWRIACVLAGLGGLALSSPAVAGFEGDSPYPLKTKEVKWSASLRGFGGFDTNVSLTPKDSFYDASFPPNTDNKDLEGASFLGAQIGGVYTLLNDGMTRVAVGGTASQTFFLGGRRDLAGDTIRDYNLTVLSPQLTATRKITVLGRPGEIGASYTYRREGGPIEAVGLDAHTIAANGAIAFTPAIRGGVDVSYTSNDFEVEFPDPELDDRDGDSVALGAFVEHALPHNGRIVLSYRYVDNDANGMNFDYTSHNSSIRVEAPISQKLWVAVEAGKDWRDYDGFQSTFVPAPGRTRQGVFNLGAQAIWILTPKTNVDFFVQHSILDSNTEQFEANKTTVGMGITRKFGGGVK